ILRRVGADAIVFPEKEMGSRIAKSLVATNFADWIELSDDYSLVETEIPESWIGESLLNLRVRQRFDINVVGLIVDGHVEVSLDPNKPLPAKGILILVGSNKALQKFKHKK
ncbi:MAG: TrkA family potassium uptake protein, partial [Eubacteriales bacterium]